MTFASYPLAQHVRLSLARVAVVGALMIVTAAQGQDSSGSSQLSLLASAGVTALNGEVATTSGQGLAGVIVSDNTQSTITDSAGRFLLAAVPPGHSVLHIDGRRVGVKHDQDFGTYEVGASAQAGKTTPLGFTIWLTPIDHGRDTVVSTPTAEELRVSNPAIPGLELRIDAGVTIVNSRGEPVTKIGITALPPLKTPYPLLPVESLPTFFTIQPADACLYAADGSAGHAHLFLPNYGHHAPGARRLLLHYVPNGAAWRPFGTGTVSRDGQQIVPDSGAVISDFGSAECDRSRPSHIDLPTRVQLKVLHP